ncbi:MAG TPA: DNA polymerase III subunit alpha [Nevskiales bacterium]|nr:DNA polymerase III subunit alpha [Nevskiales bacterium]
MPTPRFIHLRVHSEYSLVDGTVRLEAVRDKHSKQLLIPGLFERLQELHQPAVALTDESNLFALVKFYGGAQKAGIKPLAGADLWLQEGAGEAPTRLTLLCRDREGYLNLSRLLTRGYLEGQQGGRPLLRRAWLDGLTGGLIALSGAREGDIGRALLGGRVAQAQQALDFWRGLFPGSFYIELQRTGRSQEEAYLEAAVELALREGLPLVATNDVRFLRAEDFPAHEARVCIQEGYTLEDARRPRRCSDQQYLKSAEQMAELFADLPEALENTVEIARRCNLEIELGRHHLPDFPVPKAHTVVSYLRLRSEEGLQQRLPRLVPDGAPDTEARRRVYQERLERELAVIEKMGFPGYFLIVADFIEWAKTHGVPVGPGRGSGAGSLVAYCLGITDLDPLAYDLLFERFLNPERVSMPDFDIDFCKEGRDRVIEYVAQRYGREKVSQIITFGTMAARAAVRDVGRVLGHPYGMVDAIAKLVPSGPQNLDITLDQALRDSPELKRRYDDEEEVRYLIDLARTLEGLARNAGKHAGGVVIAPSALTDFTPLYCEAGGEHAVTQFDKDDVEKIGLVKFDFLGLSTLTIINHALRLLNAERATRGEPPIDINTLPLDDAATYELLRSGDTTGVFQLESGGMRRYLKALKPDCFEDIVAMVALYRPGPLQSGMVDDFIARKHGQQKVSYPHPALEAVLKPTYGTIVYQEQVMQIAQVLAGYTLGGADLLRRAMGKKDAKIMAEQRSKFVTGAVHNGVAQRVAEEIFGLIEKFAEYGFNKSHSAAYALVTYQTAWLKAHYPAAFMCAVLTEEMGNTDKLVKMIDGCRRLGIVIEPPDVNRSDYAFTVVDPKTVRYGLGAIRGVGQTAVEGVLADRNAHGPFTGLDDFCQRIDLRKLNRRVLETLIQAGALDSFASTRAGLMQALPQALARAERDMADRSAGQVDLFGGAAPVAVAATPEVPEWPEAERLRLEKNTLGLYLTGHPILMYAEELRPIVSGRLGDLIQDVAQAGEYGRSYGPGGGNGDKSVVVAGLLVDKRRIRNGNRTVLTLDDQSERIECVLFEEKAREYEPLLQPDKLLIVQGRLSYDDYGDRYRITPQSLTDLEGARRQYATRILLNAPEAVQIDLDALEHCLGKYRRSSGCPVTLRYHNGRARAELTLDDAWKVQVCEALLGDLKRLFGDGSVQVLYRRPA